MTLKEDALFIVKSAISGVMPDAAVRHALQNRTFGSGRLILVSVGKAGYEMAKTASEVLGSRIDQGIVITKYGHAKGSLPKIVIREAGHPVPDENTFSATEEALRMTEDLTSADTVLFLLSGGGSALFEKPLIAPEELREVTRQLLASGADIKEVNTIRKRFSAVKGGRFGEHCQPAKVFSIVLSDVIGDPLDVIASGPAYPDRSTAEDALGIADRCGLVLSDNARSLLDTELIKELPNVETMVTGSVRELCKAAANASRMLGYEPVVLTDSLSCEARDAGIVLSGLAIENRSTDQSLAFIMGGETVVHLTGSGKGGRNQEIALAAAKGIAELENTAIFSVGSDGTDGPPDAAGGYVDQDAYDKLASRGIDPDDVLKNNDAYTALSAIDSLIVTGPTGTNVNDVSVLLIKR